MINVRKDFPFFKKNEKIIYFDNAATTLKPKDVINRISNVNTNYSFNSYRTEYKGSIKLQKLINNARKYVATFINASANEINYTYNATFGINHVALMLEEFLNDGDEIILSYSEHSSNLLPWFNLTKKKDIKIRFLKLSNDNKITLSNFKKLFNSKTKIVALTIISNVIGKINECEEIGNFINGKCYYVLDAVQSVAHIKTNVKKLKCDFLIFSGHKILGPTGIGVVFTHKKLLKKLNPIIVGGGMNLDIYKNYTYTYKNSYLKFEAGTPNYAGILGLDSALKYIKKIGFKKIIEHEQKLLNYFYKKAKNIKNMVIYNKNTDIGIVSFNIKKIFCQDVVDELSNNNIFLRAGDNCVKLLNNYNKENKYIRASFYIYNTKEEIDFFFKIIKKGGDFLNVFF